MNVDKSPYFILVILSILFSNVNGIKTSIRLVNGPNHYSGRVEVYHNGWGTICDDNVGAQEADVICRMLGYKLVVPHWHSSAYYGQGSGDILMDGLQCNGNETDIADCPFNGWGKHDCSHSEDAGVNCEEIQIRLVGGNSKYSGRLEIKKTGGTWATVTSQGFTLADANTVCQYLSGISGGAKLFTDNRYGPGAGQVFKVRQGQLQVVTSDPFTTTTLSHSSDVGIECIHTQLRLVGGTKPSEGRVEVFYNGVWGTVCEDGFSTNDAKVVCSSLELTDASGRIVVHHGGSFGKSQGPVWLSNIRCSGSERDLNLCPGTTWSLHTCASGNDAAVECVTNPIRLTGGVGPWEGRLEVQHSGRWGTVCGQGFGREEAQVVCRILGYSLTNIEPEVLANNYFSGLSQLPILLDNLACFGNEIDIAACRTEDWQQTNCSYRQDVGVRCQPKNVRLVDGSHSLEGRVEVHVNGSWGTVCDDNWDDMDATTVCRMLLEYPVDLHVIGNAAPGGRFGSGNGRVILSDVQCNGTEGDLLHCHVGSKRRVDCDHSRDAGVSCSITTNTTLINQQGQFNDQEGSVQITDFAGTHGICDDGWGRKEAMTVCRSLGYWSTSPTVYKDDWFGRHSSTAYNILPQCHGNEVDLSFCTLGNVIGRVSCSTGDTAGLRCTPSALGYTNVELVDGDNPGAGRVDVHYNNQWGSVCYENWTDANSDVVCKMLRFRRHNTTFRPVKQASRPILIGEIDCHGNETDIGLCKANIDKSGCNGNVAHVDCTGGVKARVDSNTTLGGRLQLLKDGAWRYVCYDGMDRNAAKVSCEMLGYRHMYTNPSFTYTTLQSIGTDAVLLRSGMCSGWERHIGQCSSPLQITDQCTSNRGVNIECFPTCHVTYTNESGSFHSTHYPLYYNNLTDCLYIIKPPTNHTAYKLQIADFDMADTFDFVDIREGANGQRLGFLSSGSTFPVFAAKEFWVRFVTNSEKSGRGFNMTWSPLTIEDVITVNCGPTSWNTVVNMTLLRQLYPHSSVSQVYLTRQSCTGTVVGDLLVFDQLYTDCGSAETVNDDKIVYHNQLAYPDSTTPFPMIVHGYKWRVDIDCGVSRQGTVAQLYKPTEPASTVSSVHHHVGGNANYNINLQFFKDPGFFQEIKGDPITTNIGENVYVQVSTTTNDPRIKMKLETCVAKPSATAGPSQTYTLIRNGCVVDPDTTIISQGSHQTRFLFNSFEFPSNHDVVYVSCNATFCETTDVSQNCNQICNHRRGSMDNAVEITRGEGHTIDIYRNIL